MRMLNTLKKHVLCSEESQATKDSLINQIKNTRNLVNANHDLDRTYMKQLIEQERMLKEINKSSFK